MTDADRPVPLLFQALADKRPLVMAVLTPEGSRTIVSGDSCVCIGLIEMLRTHVDRQVRQSWETPLQESNEDK